MGECLITRRVGDSYKLPVLDANYPADVTTTVIKGNTTSATFNAVIAEPGSPAKYTYQWYVNGSPVIGATGSTYTRSGLSATATYNVYCEVTNKKGTVTSRIATLNVVQQYTPVLDSSYPQDGIVAVGVALTSKVVIATAGNPAPTYQWYKNGVAVSGATSDSYTYTPSAGSADTLYCMVSNSAGSVKSRTATITVKQYLYTWGHDITNITGGWGVKISKYDGITFTPKNDNSFMSITRGLSSEGMVCTNAIIDLSKYKLLYCRAMRTCGGDFRFGVMPTNDKMNNYSAFVDVPISNDFSWLIVDISSINSGYIGFDTGMQTNNPGYMQAVEIYLV